jgi:hypothetical protein
MQAQRQDNRAAAAGVDLRNRPAGAQRAPQRGPVVQFFARRAVLSSATGRWHAPPAGRDRAAGERATRVDHEEVR